MLTGHLVAAALSGRGETMSAQEPIAFLRRRGFLVAMFAAAACDSDPIPIVKDDGNSPSLSARRSIPVVMPGLWPASP